MASPFARPASRPTARACGRWSGGVIVGYGPELFPGFGALTLSGTTPPTQNGSSVIFTAASNLAAAAATVTLENDTTYRVQFTVAALTLGQCRVLVYGPTTNHLGAGPDTASNGTVTAFVTTSGTGSLTNQIRIQATGTGTNNTYNITACSVKKVLLSPDALMDEAGNFLTDEGGSVLMG